jgi:uncharacterized membrane protein
MYGHMAGWAWLWMSAMMIFWLVVLGVVIYTAVKLANRDSRGSRPSSPKPG